MLSRLCKLFLPPSFYSFVDESEEVKIPFVCYLPARCYLLLDAYRIVFLRN